MAANPAEEYTYASFKRREEGPLPQALQYASSSNSYERDQTALGCRARPVLYSRLGAEGFRCIWRHEVPGWKVAMVALPCVYAIRMGFQKL